MRVVMNEKMTDGMHIDSDGTKQWYKGGYLHRLDGPAVEYKNGYTEWWLNGYCHRIGGPAIKGGFADKDDETYCLYGDFYYEDEYNKWISNLPLLYWERFKRGEWI